MAGQHPVICPRYSSRIGMGFTSFRGHRLIRRPFNPFLVPVTVSFSN
jgi:hypothetical protein